MSGPAIMPARPSALGAGAGAGRAASYRRPCDVAAVIASVLPALDLAFAVETHGDDAFGPLGDAAPARRPRAFEAA